MCMFLVSWRPWRPAVYHGGACCRLYGWVGGGEGYYPATLPTHHIGIARAQPLPQPAFLRPPWHSRALCALPHTMAPRTQYTALQDQYRRDSALNILKLVIIQECRRKSFMRPGILPVSKPAPKVTTLNSPYFRLAQPSLTRNKWSCLWLRPVFIVKTAKCHHNVHIRCRGTVTAAARSIPPPLTLSAAPH